VSGDETKDPLGKRALFGGATGTGGALAAGSEAATDGDVELEAEADAGKRALFSQSQAKRGSMVLECSHCHARTPISLSDLAGKLITAPIFFPFRPHRRLMRCPACRDTTWVTVKRG
jgi:hypothetical protein